MIMELIGSAFGVIGAMGAIRDQKKASDRFELVEDGVNQYGGPNYVVREKGGAEPPEKKSATCKGCGSVNFIGLRCPYCGRSR